MIKEVLFLLFMIVFHMWITNLTIKKFKGYAYSINLVGKDRNKINAPSIPESFGIPIMLSLSFSLLLFFLFSHILNISVFNKTDVFFSYLLGGLFITILGFLEDLTILKNKKDIKKKGFEQKYKPLIPLLASLPISIVMLHHTIIYLPILGKINLMLFYPLLIIPIGIIGSSNATNMLAGLNGLESLLGIITTFFLMLFSFLNNQKDITILAFFFIASLLIFYRYNKYPAQIFPGDSLTYLIGYTIGALSILGNMEKFGASIFILWYIELLLKARSKFKAESFGKLKDGKLYRPYNKIYSLTHLFMNGKNSEKDIVFKLGAIHTLICIIMFILFTLL